MFHFSQPLPLPLLALIAAGLYAGIQNALAGGGSFITFRPCCWPGSTRWRPI
jgi:uncharacterized membrane protein YfcA